jgi:CubicO group peptidase (beta-lactamase class C family)
MRVPGAGRASMRPMSRRRFDRIVASLLVVGAVLAGCSGDGGDDGASAGAEEQAVTEQVPGADWTVEDPEDHGMDPEVLEGAREYAFAEGRNTQGVVVVRDGVIVAEWYADGAGPDSWAASWSVAKSFTSALVGIAVEEGAIPGVDEPMTRWYPEWEGTPAADMTLEDVLQMSSGLAWTEDYSPESATGSDIIRMVVGERDHLAYAASVPPEVEPGTRWSYSSGDTMLLSGVLEQATGMPVHEYAEEKLFEPLGIDQVDWWRDAEGHTLTYCCLDMPSRDFARLGLLYLREGRWGDEQVVPEEWVEASLTPAPTSDGYGYQWWLGGIEGLPEDTFSARGHDGQYIIVVPSLDLVVVRNGTYAKDPGEPVADPNLFSRYPPQGLVPDKGTRPPDDWDNAEFLRPIVESIEEP